MAIRDARIRRMGAAFAALGLLLFAQPAIAAAPDAPTIGTATAGDGQVSVTFTAPASDGGSAITTYTATASSGGASGTCTGPGACTATVTGLTNGTAYTFTVTATNADGVSGSSGASNSVTPKGNQTITFPNPGAQNFGTAPALSSTASATSSLTPTFSSSTTGVCTITSGGTLTFVTAGSCTIDADQAGNTAWNAATTVTRTFTVNAVIPGAPTIGTATAGDTQATVTFTAPASTGGAAIIASGYTVTASPGGANATGSSSPITVTGLTNGLAYTFTVTATNSAGEGAPSAASNSITPATPQTITFGNPGVQNFGTTPTLTATSDAGGGYPVSFTSSTTGVCTITAGGALTFVAVGSCTINADQAGDWSFLAAPQVSQTFTVAAVVPGAPTAVTATAGDTQASIAFTAPAFTGGGAIASYTVTANPGGIHVNGASSPLIVTGLTNGAPYTFTVTATNSAGTGPASPASNSITPAATQTITFVTPGAQNFGTTPTLSATADSGLTPIFTSSTTGVCTITSGGALTFVAAGNCTINADQAGNGSYLPAAQVTRNFAVNAVAPGLATINSVTPGDGQATIAFTPPVFTGGGLTGYRFTASVGGLTTLCPASPCVFPGLTNGITYSFTMQALNGPLTGAVSAASSPVTPMASTPPLPSQAGQTISGLAVSPAAPVFRPGGTFGVSAAGGGSSSPVVFAIAPASAGVCAISGATVTTLAAGVCTITADQAGDATHLPAPTATLAVTIGAATPTLSWTGDLTKNFGDPAFELADPKSDSKGAFSFASSDPAVAHLSGRTVTLVGPGTAILTATQAAAGDFTSASVSLTLSVTARPDPTKDPTVTAASQAQVDAAVRFAAAQQANVQSRLRQLRSADGTNASSNGMTFNLQSAAGRDMSLPTSVLNLDGAGLPQGWGLWTAGALIFDERAGADGFAGFDVRSEGLSMGLDRQVGDGLILGVAAGVGWNDTDFDGSSSDMEGRQGSVSGYGLWRLDEHLFVDGLVGWGRLDFDVDRWSADAGALASAERNGDQWFGSLTLGYEQRGPRGALTGYGRLDGSRTKLDAYRESGLGAFDLAYREQTIESSSLAFGIEGGRLFKHGQTGLRPFGLIEYRAALQNSGDQAMNYVLNPATSDYILSLRSFNDDAWVLGAGLDIDLPAGWLLSLSYRREDGSETDSNGYALSVTYRGEATRN